MKKEIQDKKIIKQLKEKESLAQENVKILKEMEELEKKVNKNSGKLKRIDEKVRPSILREASKIVLKEYEELTRVFNDNGKWTMEFTDQLEVFKNNWKKRNEK